MTLMPNFQSWGLSIIICLLVDYECSYIYAKFNIAQQSLIIACIIDNSNSIGIGVRLQTTMELHLFELAGEQTFIFTALAVRTLVRKIRVHIQITEFNRRELI